MRNTSDERQSNSEITGRTALTGLVVNLLLTALKAYAGFAANSRALVADSVHSLSDISTDIAVIIGSRYWCRPPDESHPVGHRGIETGVAIFIGLMLAAAGFGMGYEGVKALLSTRAHTVPGTAAAVAAAISIAVKETLYRWTLKKSRITGSMALAANASHNRSDALSSIPVLVAVLAARISPGLAFLDAAAGVVVSVFVVFSAWKVLWPGLLQLTNKAAPPEFINRIRATALEAGGVMGVHDLRARLQAGGIFVDLHLQVEGQIQVEQAFLTAREVEKAILALDPSIKDVIARIEPWAPCGDADRCPADL